MHICPGSISTFANLLFCGVSAVLPTGYTSRFVLPSLLHEVSLLAGQMTHNQRDNSFPTPRDNNSVRNVETHVRATSSATRDTWQPTRDVGRGMFHLVKLGEFETCYRWERFSK